MSKFATTTRPAVFSPVRSVSPIPDTITAEGGEGYTCDAKSELFLLAVTNMVAEKAFYEDAAHRDERYERLIHQVTKEDPAWIGRFVPFLRGTMNMRSASLVMAAEYVRAGGSKGRNVIAAACQRADEPAEMLGYWLGHYGKRIPAPVKRGIADAAVRLYTERAALKYDGDKAVRMGDVIELTHPKPAAPWQDALFGYLIAKRHDRERLDIEALPTIRERVALEALLPEIRPARLADGLPEGTTWEWASSWLGGKLTPEFWSAMIPNMGYMALLRNLRNFDETGVDDVTAVLVKLADPDEVARSRQFPLRFLSAVKAVKSVRWHAALEAAINHSLANVPALGGRTLIMVDDSSSMDGSLSAKSQLARREAASIFGAALALRAEDATLIAFADAGIPIPVSKGGSILLLAGAIARATTGGTRTMDVLSGAYAGHNRVIILTDEQAFAPAFSFSNVSVSDVLAKVACPIYTFNLAGYEAGHLPSGSANRHTFGGLTDAGFVAIDLLERGKDAEWPF